MQVQGKDKKDVGKVPMPPEEAADLLLDKQKALEVPLADESRQMSTDVDRLPVGRSFGKKSTRLQQLLRKTRPGSLGAWAPRDADPSDSFNTVKALLKDKIEQAQALGKEARGSC